MNVDHLTDLIVRIARERDKYHTQWITQITPNPSDQKAEATKNQTTINTDQNHLAVELADLKSKLRKLRQDLYAFFLYGFFFIFLLENFVFSIFFPLCQ